MRDGRDINETTVPWQRGPDSPNLKNYVERREVTLPVRGAPSLDVDEPLLDLTEVEGNEGLFLIPLGRTLVSTVITDTKQFFHWKVVEILSLLQPDNHHFEVTTPSGRWISYVFN